MKIVRMNGGDVTSIAVCLLALTRHTINLADFIGEDSRKRGGEERGMTEAAELQLTVAVSVAKPFGLLALREKEGEGMEMTIERLRAFRGIQKEKDEIMREIDLLYYPISSPGSSDFHSTTPGDPTASTVAKIMRRQERLKELTQELAEELDYIENWVESLDDHELRAIIRAHYLMGENWKRCTQRILNYRSSDAAKYRVYRYFGITK